jgi:Zn-dependent M28 family amino/carboxypeptidase
MGLHNGADDNASGTVAVLELARLFKDYADNGGMGDEDRRSVLFSFFGAEEIGLLGSCNYVENPLVPLSDTKAMMNFDMVGRLREGTVYVRGTELAPELWPLVRNSNEPELNVIDAPACARCSDHSCFMFAGIPFVWFFTGSHEDYHTPRDDADLINYAGLADIAEVSLRSLVRLAVSQTSPTFVPPS